mgnify:FL=1
MKKNKLFWILTVVCVLNFAAHLYFYPSLPDIVPTHWGASGQVNGWGPKSTVLILAALPFAMLILFEVIRKIDPKHQNFEKFGKVWNLFVVLFTVMMAAFSWLSELAVFGKLPDSSNLVSILVCGGIGVLFIILGNFMPQIKQNYTFGCRTPWALNDEHNWQRTQRMGGYTFVVMGIVLLVLAFLGGLLGDIATLIVLLAGQTLFMILYVVLVVFNIMGRDYDAAVIVSGTCGFGMGATPNAMANMQAICDKYSPSVKAYLLIPLVGSLFADFLNSLVITVFINFI